MSSLLMYFQERGTMALTFTHFGSSEGSTSACLRARRTSCLFKGMNVPYAVGSPPIGRMES